MTKPTVIIDTREQRPWSFAGSGFTMVRRKLETADYSVEGYEGHFAIERKGGVAEVAGNLVDKDGRFRRELERLQSYPHAHVIFEFALEDLYAYPHGAGIPRSRMSQIRARGPYLGKLLVDLMFLYPSIHWHFAGPRGEKLAVALIKRFLQEQEQEQNCA